MWRSNCPKVRKRSLSLQEQKTQGSVDKRNKKLGAISKKTCLNSARNCLTERNMMVFIIPKEDLEAHLRKKYTDPFSDTPLKCLNEPNRPHPLEGKFDDSPLKLGEIKDFDRKAQAKSPPGNNGISYKLYKRCPRILTLLWKLWEAYSKKFIADNWGLADGIHIPKEKDSWKIE